jgi:hypothetical protein
MNRQFFVTGGAAAVQRIRPCYSQSNEIARFREGKEFAYGLGRTSPFGGEDGRVGNRRDCALSGTQSQPVAVSPVLRWKGSASETTMTTENLFFWPGSRPWRTRTLDRDHDPAILGPVRWRVIWCHRMGIAKPLGRDDLRVHPLRDQKGYNGTGSPRR